MCPQVGSDTQPTQVQAPSIPALTSGFSAQAAGTVLLDLEVSAWSCHSGSEQSPFISEVQRSEQTPRHQSGPSLGDPVSPPSLTSPWVRSIVGSGVGGGLHFQTRVRFSWPPVVQGGACDPRSKQAEGGPW